MNSQNHETTQAMRKNAMVCRRPFTIHECQMQIASIESIAAATASGRSEALCIPQLTRCVTAVRK